MKLRFYQCILSVILFAFFFSEDGFAQNAKLVLIKKVRISVASTINQHVTFAPGAIYSDITNFTGQGFAVGGAATIGANTITKLSADNLHFAGSAPYSITGFVFTVANTGGTSVSARPIVRFYKADGAGGLPGTLITGFTFNPITFAASSVSLFSFNTSFTVPSSDIWAGITFDDNNGATGATASQLNNLGQGIFNPVDVGSSTDQFFATSTAGDFNSNNPPGGLLNFGGSPVANFGWQFTQAAVSVTATAGTAGPSGYTDLKSAFSAINAGTHQGAVTININADIDEGTTPSVLNASGTGSANYTSVLIHPSVSGVTVTGNINTSNGVIELVGADNVTIDGSTSGGTAAGIGGDASLRNLTVRNTGTTITNSAVIAVKQGTNGAQNVTIKNLNVSGQGPTVTLIGIFSGANSVAMVPSVNSNNLIIENCDVQKVIDGIVDFGVSVNNSATGHIVRRNNLSATGANRVSRLGILVLAQNGIQVTENRIGGLSENENLPAIGIGAGVEGIDPNPIPGVFLIINSTISNNIIDGVVSTNTTGYSAAGIGIAGGTGANTIANNMISGVTAPSTGANLVAGIFVQGVSGSSTNVFYNTVSLSGDRGAVANQTGSYGIAITGDDPAVTVKNNIFTTTQTSGGGANAKSYALGTASSTFVNLTADYNDFFSSGANAGGFRSGSLGASGTDYATLAAWQGATGKDANSINVQPVFTSASDLHLVPASNSGIDNKGTPITSPAINSDIDGDARNASTPDIGADEFIGAPAGCTSYTFAGTLGGSNSVPANASTATGTYSGTYNSITNVLTLNLTFSNLTGGSASAAHIHTGFAGTNGPVVIPFPGFPGATSGTYSNTFTGISPANGAALISGNAYINIHNSVFPGGEIRGQIVSVPTCTNNWYVNDNSTVGNVFTTVAGNDATGTGSASAPFATINKAMSMANNGDAIFVDAGDYTEFVNVTKSLKFYGANYILTPNATPTSVRVPEAVVHAPSPAPFPANDHSIFEIRTSGTNVEVKGFKMMDGNPIHDGHMHRDAGNPQNISVLFEKNYVKNADHVFAGTLTRWISTTIRDNLFEDINYSTNISSAIQLNDAVTGLSGPHTATMTATIEDNVINTTEFAGILLDNIATATVQRNKLSNMKGEAGIQLAGGMGNATVTMNEITNANTASAGADDGGIRIYGSGFTGSVNITNNLVTGCLNGFAVKNSEAITDPNIHINNNSFAGNTNKSMYHGGTDPGGNGGSTYLAAPNTLDGECNWHGSSDGAVVSTKVQGPIDYIFFLTSPTDADPGTIGFQPTGICGGGPIAPPPTGGDDNIHIYPVPVISMMKVEYQSIEQKKVEIIIIDQLGRILQKENTIVVKGINLMQFDVHRLIKGIYTVIISDGVKQWHEKMVKM